MATCTFALGQTNAPFSTNIMDAAGSGLGMDVFALAAVGKLDILLGTAGSTWRTGIFFGNGPIEKKAPWGEPPYRRQGLGCGPRLVLPGRKEQATRGATQLWGSHSTSRSGVVSCRDLENLNLTFTFGENFDRDQSLGWPNKALSSGGLASPRMDRLYRAALIDYEGDEGPRDEG